MKRIQYDTSVFTNEDSLSYYLLGVWYTDGNMRKSTKLKNGCGVWTASLSSVDLAWLKSIRNLFSSDIRLRRDNRNKNLYRLDLNNRVIYEWLIANGCVPNKTLIIKFPTIPTKYIPDFIRGCIDGDGSVLFKKEGKTYWRSTIALSTASKAFRDGVSNAVKELGINMPSYTMDHKKKPVSFIDGRKIVSKNDVYVLRISGDKAIELARLLYYSKDVFCLPRKMQNAKKMFRYAETHQYRKVVAIPSKKELIQMLKTMLFQTIINKYGVTSKVIYRWLKIYGLPKVRGAKQYYSSK